MKQELSGLGALWSDCLPGYILAKAVMLNPELPYRLPPWALGAVGPAACPAGSLLRLGGTRGLRHHAALDLLSWGCELLSGILEATGSMWCVFQGHLFLFCFLRVAVGKV